MAMDRYTMAIFDGIRFEDSPCEDAQIGYLRYALFQVVVSEYSVITSSGIEWMMQSEMFLLESLSDALVPHMPWINQPRNPA
jgi:hypothetical protein